MARCFCREPRPPSRGPVLRANDQSVGPEPSRGGPTLRREPPGSRKMASTRRAHGAGRRCLGSGRRYRRARPLPQTRPDTGSRTPANSSPPWSFSAGFAFPRGDSGFAGRMPRHVPFRARTRLTVELLCETIPDGHVWWRLADPAWANPLDANFAREHGGRWNPPGSFLVLYLNEDIVTARLNLRAFIAGWPYEPQDLREDTGPNLVGCTLPRRQIACDAHSPVGVHTAGLPHTYPLETDGSPVPHTRCQFIGARAKSAGLRGVRARSAQSRDGAGRELAWFPASIRSVARKVRLLAFSEWFWG